MVYVDEHLKKYPLMETQDVLKLHLQGILGPAHLVGEIGDVVANLQREYDSIKDLDYQWDLVEYVSDKYARIYLKPFYLKFGTFLPLAECFKQSAELVDTTEYWKTIQSLKDRFDGEVIDRYIELGNPLIRHSETYRQNYHPHYLVVATKYLSSLIGNDF